MQELLTKMRLLRFDGQVLESFTADGCDRYHVTLMSKIEINDKRKHLEFDYGLWPGPRRVRLGFDEAELPAVAAFMQAVAAASG